MEILMQNNVQRQGYQLPSRCNLFQKEEESVGKSFKCFASL